MGSRFGVCAASVAVFGAIACLAFPGQTGAPAGGAEPAPCSPVAPGQRISGSSKGYSPRDTAEQSARDDAALSAKELCRRQQVPAACADSSLKSRIEYGAMTCAKGFLSRDQYKCTVDAEFWCICTECKRK